MNPLHQAYGYLNFQDYTVLVIDDNPTNLSVAVDYLEECGFTILVSQNGKSGLKRAAYAHPNIILLDILMPGINGFETCRLLKENPETQDIPVIFMTALSDMESKIKGFASGAVDYVTKPIQVEEVLARITVHLRLQSLTQQLAQQKQQLKQQNLNLEQRVNARTVELRKSLRDLEQTKSKLERSFEKIVEAKEAAELANIVKEQFLTRMSHELRTPLNAILGFSELLQIQLSNQIVPANLEQGLRIIHHEGNQLLRLVDEVLELSGIEVNQSEFHLAHFELDSLLDELLSAVGTLALKNANRLEVRAEDGQVWRTIDLYETPGSRFSFGKIYGDRNKIYRILFNILENACKFTQGGKIIITISRQINPNRGSGLIKFVVRDMGIGISAEHQERIFEPFAQVDESNTRVYDGAGLGLTIAKKLCQMLNGTITVESSLHQGSTFTIQLPIQVPIEMLKL
jgi:signal transduction histidine kinase